MGSFFILSDYYTRTRPFTISQKEVTGQALEDGSDVTFKMTNNGLVATYSSLPEGSKPEGRLMLGKVLIAQIPGRIEIKRDATTETLTIGGGATQDVEYTYEARVRPQGKSVQLIKSVKFEVKSEK